MPISWALDSNEYAVVTICLSKNQRARGDQRASFAVQTCPVSPQIKHLFAECSPGGPPCAIGPGGRLRLGPNGACGATFREASSRINLCRLRAVFTLILIYSKFD